MLMARGRDAALRFGLLCSVEQSVNPLCAAKGCDTTPKLPQKSSLYSMVHLSQPLSTQCPGRDNIKVREGAWFS